MKYDNPGTHFFSIFFKDPTAARALSVSLY